MSHLKSRLALVRSTGQAYIPIIGRAIRPSGNRAEAQMTKVSEMTRTRQIGQMFVVELLSSVHGKWIVVGEHTTPQAAKADMKMWRVA